MFIITLKCNILDHLNNYIKDIKECILYSSIMDVSLDCGTGSRAVFSSETQREIIIFLFTIYPKIRIMVSPLLFRTTWVLS